MDNRRIDPDGLPHTDAPIFTGGWATRALKRVNDVDCCEFTCTVCNGGWLVPLDRASNTSNLYKHYAAKHKTLDPHSTGNEAEENAIPGRQRAVTDFWAVGQQADTSYVRKRGVPFVLDTFLRLVIHFIVSNSLAIRLVTTPSFKHLIQYTSRKDIVLNTQQIIRHMIRYY
jgi:hypothetical protein